MLSKILKEKFMTAKSKFGEEFKRLVIEKGLTLKELSERSGLSVAQLSNLQSGQCEPTVQTIYKLSEALNSDYDKLFDASTEKR